jgi:Cu/Ag efflux protein CusF
MRSIFAPLFAIALVAAIGAAKADEAAGTIQAINQEERILVLDDGTAFTLGDGVTVEDLEAGDEVTVVFEEKDGQKVVVKILTAE